MLKRIDDTIYGDTQIGFYECDCYGRAKMSMLLKRITDFAGVDYAECGYDRKELDRRDMAFLVSSVSIRIKTPVIPYEPITLATYERGVKGARFYRGSFIEDEQGNTIVCCKTVWLLCSPSNRKILRPSAFDKQINEHWERQLDCEEAKRIKTPDNCVFAGEKTVRYSDLDGNGHVNNGVYVDIACDFAPTKLLEKGIYELYAEFKREAVLGDTLKIYTSEHDGVFTVVGKLDEAESFICEMRF